jgi:chitin disaccharide deacetylase
VAEARRKVVLCADDFGLSEAVSRGILELAARGRISATSAMTTCAAWPRTAPQLLELKGRVAVGLHLNLTAGAPLGAMPRFAPGGAFPAPNEVLRRALTGGLPVEEIGDEIARQLEAFEQALGRPPTFVDGHQHVHVLPGIRAALLHALQQGSYAGLWLRDPSDDLRAILRRALASKKALIVRSLSLRFGEAARAAGFDVNEGFSGFSPFDAQGRADRVFRRALKFLGPRPVVMCHPGYVDDALRSLDSVVDTRPQELAFLASDAFPALLERRGVELAPAPLA